MRLIDADALEYHTQLECMGNGQYEDVKVVYEWEIDNAPTIDAVEVVRCKECESYVECAYWFDDKDKRHECHICTAHSIEVGTDDFCSFGQRKE